MAMYEYITNDGYRLLQRMLAGECTIDFTRVEMGNGNYPESDLKKVKALSNVIVSLDVDSVVKQEDNTLSISAIFSNEGLKDGFYFKEKGIFASDGEKEILFSYANAGSSANYIDPPSVEIIEKIIITHVTQLQRTTEPVNVVIKSGIYVTSNVFESFVSSNQEALETVAKEAKSYTDKKVTISKIEQTTTSTADGGTNVITATLSDGTKSKFNIKNGSKGSTGPQGATGPQGPKGETSYDAKTVGGLSPSSFLGNGTNFVRPYMNGGNIDEILYEYHGFVFNVAGLPSVVSSGNYGFLDVSFFNGEGFNIAPNGVVRQVYTLYNCSYVCIRTASLGNPWGSWKVIKGDNNTQLGGEPGACVIEHYTSNNHNAIRFFPEGWTTQESLTSQIIMGRNSDGTYVIRPYSSNKYSLGTSAQKWKDVYAVNGTIQTSDRNKKHDISYIGESSDYDTAMSDDQLTQLIMEIKPAIFKRDDSDSERPHHGIIAQDFEKLLQEIGLSDHAAFIKSPKVREIQAEDKDGEKQTKVVTVEGEYDYGFRYEELLSDVIRFAQILKKENDDIKKENSNLNDRLLKIEECLKIQ